MHGTVAGLRVVLTGASGGIGQELADRLASAGAQLALVGRNAESLGALSRRLAAEAIIGDLTDSEFLARLPTRLADLWGAMPDVLINSAGFFELAPLVDTEGEILEKMLAVNLRAPFELTRAVLPGMLERGAGHIVNVGSIAGRKAFPGNAAYSASKFGLRGLHEVLVEELRGTGVRATWVEPSAVDTPLWDRFDPDSRPDLPARDAMLRPGAVADAVMFAITQPTEVAVEEIIIRSNPAGGRAMGGTGVGSRD